MEACEEVGAAGSEDTHEFLPLESDDAEAKTGGSKRELSKGVRSGFVTIPTWPVVPLGRVLSGKSNRGQMGEHGKHWSFY